MAGLPIEEVSDSDSFSISAIARVTPPTTVQYSSRPRPRPALMSRARRGPAAEVGSGRRKAIFDPVLCDGAASAGVLSSRGLLSCVYVRACLCVRDCVCEYNK